jgi:hypothetical protein
VLCHPRPLPLNWPILDNAQARSAVALRSLQQPVQAERSFSVIFLSISCFFHVPVSAHYSSRVQCHFMLYTLCRCRWSWALIPQRSPVNSLRNSDMLPILRKAQFKGPCGRLVLERSQILPIDSGESPPFESPQFHAPQIRFNHVLQLKKQPFNSGARTFR